MERKILNQKVTFLKFDGLKILNEIMIKLYQGILSFTVPKALGIYQVRDRYSPNAKVLDNCFGYEIVGSKQS